MSIKAMKLALDTFDAPILADEFEQAMRLRKACDALRQAIEQAEKQVPLAWIDGKDFAALYSKGTIDCDLKLSRLTAIDVPLYAAPPQREWVGLTENEMWAVENAIPDKVITDRDWCIHFARAIETKLKEKNCEPRQYKDLCDND